jgi:hypothetical protein
MTRYPVTNQARRARGALWSLIAPAALLAGTSCATAGGEQAADHHKGGIQAERGNAERASFDVVHAKIATEGNAAVFHMAVAGEAGAVKPAPTGETPGSDVYAYVWPTTLDPAQVGFPEDAGILAMAVTAHPDFDDTPLFDENGDGRRGNDGATWHSHWVVLGPGPECGPDALKVKDIPEGTRPDLPKTWPGLPILIDSPGWDPTFAGDTVEVRVPFEEIGPVQEMAFDGVTSGLKVNGNLHKPFLCIAGTFDVASGDLSLPGQVTH